MARLSIALALVLQAVGACQPVVPATAAPGGDAVPLDALDAGVEDTLVVMGQLGYPDDPEGPSITILEPLDGALVSSATVAVEGTFSDDVGVVALRVQVGPFVATPIAFEPHGATFHATVPLIPGPQTITVTAHDTGGNVATDSVDVTRLVDAEDLAAPALVVTSPGENFTVVGETVWCTGTASDDVGVVSLTVQLDDGPSQGVESDDGFATWISEVTLPPGPDRVLRFVATDLAGRATEVTRHGGSTLAPDTTPPSIAFTAPTDGATMSDPVVLVTGTATDDTGVVAVDVRVGGGPYAPATTTDDYVTWHHTVTLAVGLNTLTARATDGGGITATATLSLVEPSGAQWGTPMTTTLTWAAAAHPETTFELARDDVAELIVPEVAEHIVMLELDVLPLIASTLDIIRDACGPGWADGPDLSASCPASWGPPEVNLWRLVTMTPGNVNVVGTAIEGIQEMANTLSAWGLIDSFADILAAALGIDVDTLFLNDTAVASALVSHLVATHPAVLPSGHIPVTLQDALTDMSTFGPRFDASGPHPGFLDGDASTYAKVLDDDFLMVMVTTSNVHWHDGVRLGEGKAFVALLDDTTGPTYDDVLEFDFLDPTTFWVDGVADAPTADLTFKAIEHDSWVAVGDSVSPTPRGNSVAWSLDPWLLERLIAEAAYTSYATHRAGCSLCSGSGAGALLYEVPLFGIDEAEIVVGHAGYDWDDDGIPEYFDVLSDNPAGWLRAWTLFGLGSPPPPQYVWDMILEIAQRRLLDGGVQQGAGDVAFELEGIDIGLSAAEVKEAVRPVLEAQKSELSALLLGDYGANGDALDFYLTRQGEGALALTFVHPSDPVPPDSAPHAAPGFFSDPQLTTKVSDVPPGDVHETLALDDAPDTLYCADATGSLYQLTWIATGTDAVEITARAWVGEGSP